MKAKRIQLVAFLAELVAFPAKLVTYCESGNQQKTAQP